MDALGQKWFFYTIAVALMALCLFALYRTTRRVSVGSEEAGDFIVMAPITMAANLNPDFELVEIVAASETDADEIQESFEELVQDLENVGELE